MELVKAPTDQAFAAVCFAVVQTGKIRRCEDFRRSRHNETVAAEDSPAYTDVEQYIRLVQKLQQLRQGNPMIWLQDLEGAYRQVPVEQDRIAIPCSSRRRVPRSGATAPLPLGPPHQYGRFADSPTEWCRSHGDSCASRMVTSWTTSQALSWKLRQRVHVPHSETCSKNWDYV